MPHYGHEYLGEVAALASLDGMTSRQYSLIAIISSKKHIHDMILGLVFRKILLCALLIGLLVSPVTVQNHHDVSSQVAEAKRHAALALVEIVDHGHSHDDGEDYEQSADHKHGHDPADHSHQVVIFSNSALADILPGADTPFPSVSGLVMLETAFGFERPPKLTSPV